MLRDKTIARMVGALFLTTMIAGMIDSYVAMPLLSTSLGNILAHRGTILLGVFLVIFMSLGIVGIALLFFPVLKRHNALIASTYLTFRAIECVLLLVGALVPLYILALSQSAQSADAGSVAALQSLAPLAMKVRLSAFQIAMTILGLNSVVLCSLLFQTRLIPRWLALTGIIGYALLLLSAVLDLCGLISTTGLGGLLYIPGGLFETILLPFWLMVKGFNGSKEMA